MPSEGYALYVTVTNYMLLIIHSLYKHHNRKMIAYTVHCSVFSSPLRFGIFHTFNRPRIHHQHESRTIKLLLFYYWYGIWEHFCFVNKKNHRMTHSGLKKTRARTILHSYHGYWVYFNDGSKPSCAVPVATVYNTKYTSFAFDSSFRKCSICFEYMFRLTEAIAFSECLSIFHLISFQPIFWDEVKKELDIEVFAGSQSIP